MGNARSNNIVVGGFVLAMLSLLVVTLAVLAGRTGASESYFTVYNNVSGVKHGTQVLFEGFRIGQVDEIVPLHEDGRVRFRVEMAVQDQWRIPKDSVAVIAASGLLAALSIDIRAGHSAEVIPPGGTITAGPSANLFSAVNEIAGEVGALSRGGLMPLLDNLRGYLDTLGGALQRSGPEMVGNLAVVARDLAQNGPAISENLRAFTAALSETMNGPNRGRIDRSMASIEQASANIASVSAELEATRRKADALLTQLELMVVKNRDPVAGSLEDLRYTLRTVARHVDSVSQNMEGTSRNMYEFTRELRQDPSLLLRSRPAAEAAPEPARRR